MIESAFPAGDTDAPFVARLESWEAPLGARRDQVVPIKHREIEKLLGDFYADRVLANIFRSSSAKAITVKSGQRLSAAAF